MKPNIRQLFIFIKTHIMNEEHPVNKIAAVFVQNYVDFYSNEILNNSEKFQQTKIQDFEIRSSIRRNRTPSHNEMAAGDIVLQDIDMQTHPE